MAKLVARVADRWEVHSLSDSQATSLGREASLNQVALASPAVSRRHCRLEPLPSRGHRLVDLGSTNGVLLNGVEVRAAVLRPFDRLRVGDVELVYTPDGVAPHDAWRRAQPKPIAAEDTAAVCRAALRDRALRFTLDSRDAVAEEEVLPLAGALLRDLIEFTGFARGTLLLQRRGADPPTPVLGHGLGAPQGELWDLLGDALRTRQLRQGPVRDSGHEQAALCVPLVAAEGRRRPDAAERARALGALLLTRDAPAAPLPPAERELVEGIAAQLAVALQRAWLYHRATTDELTQLHNRAWLERLLADELARARARRGRLALILFDLDHFKRVNDTHGHQAGDEVLREVAVRARAALREGDVIGRWGGEEFLALLPGGGAAGAAKAADKLAAAIAAPPIGAARLHVTASLGIAVYPDHGRALEDLVRSADQALYAAKALGRARAVVYQEGMERTWGLPQEPELTSTRILPPSPATGPRGRVLVVDDEEGARLTLTALLEETYDVSAVASVDEALERLARGAFDLVITDFVLPERSGAALLEQLQTRPDPPSCILLTGQRRSPEVRELQRAGGHLVLFKPVQPRELLAWVQNELNMARLRRSVTQLRGGGRSTAGAFKAR